MDPEKVLRRAREIVQAIVEKQDHDEAGHDDYSQEACDLAECFHALDNWLTKGGFLPSQWQQGR